jgi:hypothetical protein
VSFQRRHGGCKLSVLGQSSYSVETKSRKLDSRDRWFRRTYGVTLAAYLALVDKQDGKCAKCRSGLKLTVAKTNYRVTLVCWPCALGVRIQA